RPCRSLCPDTRRAQDIGAGDRRAGSRCGADGPQSCGGGCRLRYRRCRGLGQSRTGGALLMAMARNGDVRLHWREEGAGAPLLLLNSVGCDLTLWDAVMPHLKGHRVLRMDMRGHGGSDSPPGDYTLDQIAADALAVLDAAGVEKTAIC